MAVNPLALVFVGLCTAIGLLLGHWLIGLIVGLAVVFVGSVAQR